MLFKFNVYPLFAISRQFSNYSVNNILLTSIQLQVYNSLINREKINRIWKQA